MVGCFEGEVESVELQSRLTPPILIQRDASVTQQLGDEAAFF
jgi:hypothetical protein